MAALEFQFEQGSVHFPEMGLWLDAHRPIGPDEAVFVSHAHSDHTAAHARVILSPPTRCLMRARVGGERDEQVLEFGQRHAAVDLGLRPAGAHLTLRPAGHVLGSAMILLEAEGTSLLYTGDFKLRRGLSAEVCEPCRADVLVMETTFGRPQYAFPPTHEIIAGVVRFCREALDNGETPVLLAYSLGKSQEILSGLAGAGLPIALSGPVARMTRVYESLGWVFPAYDALVFATAAGKVVLAPPGMAVASLRQKLGPCRVAALTGWAVNPGCRFRYQADAAFPLSDHADFPDLVQFVQRVAPRRVYTLHGFAADFASHLRGLGFDARALCESEQLELSLVGGVAPRAIDPLEVLSIASPMPESPPTPETPGIPGTDSPGTFHAFAMSCAAIALERTRLGKVSRTAGFLERTDRADLPAVTAWLSGSGGVSSSGSRVPVGGAVIRDALCEVSGASVAAFRNCDLKHSDEGETAAELLRHRTSDPESPLTVGEVSTFLESMASARGPSATLPQLVRLLARCGPMEARFLVRVMTCRLRIGLKEEWVEDAIAGAFAVDPEAVRAAHPLVGDLGSVALLAREGRLGTVGLVPFRPIRLMLASSESNVPALWEQVSLWRAADGGAGEGAADVWIEDGYDGIRCQLHRVGTRVALYSGDLKDVTLAFPEVSALASRLGSDVVLDGVVVAKEHGPVLRGVELQRRGGSGQRELFPGSDIPACFIAFDLLWRDGLSRLTAPFRERRAELEALSLPTGLRRSEGRWARDAAALVSGFEAARDRGIRGLMVKDPASAYRAGRRGMGWLKLDVTSGPGTVPTPLTHPGERRAGGPDDVRD